MGSVFWLLRMLSKTVKMVASKSYILTINENMLIPTLAIIISCKNNLVADLSTIVQINR